MQETEKIWMNGELVDWADAKIHVASHGLNYGSGVFEGIRCYDTAKGPAVFRLKEHLERFENSARLLYMDLPHTVEELRAATPARCSQRQCVLLSARRLLRLQRALSVSIGNPVDVVIPSSRGLPRQRHQTKTSPRISTGSQVSPNVIASRSRGFTSNSMSRPWDSARRLRRAIMLSHDGGYRGRPGREHLSHPRRRVLHTPPLSISILPGIRARSSHHDADRLIRSRALLIQTDLYLMTKSSWSGRQPRSRRCARSTTTGLASGQDARLREAYLAAVAA
jgi:branched-chain amino acid aminotransferase